MPTPCLTGQSWYTVFYAAGCILEVPGILPKSHGTYDKNWSTETHPRVVRVTTVK